MTAFTEADRKRILESLTSEDLATLKEAFTVYDKNNDGTITTKVSNIYLDENRWRENTTMNELLGIVYGNEITWSKSN